MENFCCDSIPLTDKIPYFEGIIETGVQSGINSQHIERLRKILALLETAETVEDMDLPGLGSHPLKGNRKGDWAIKDSVEPYAQPGIKKGLR